MPTTTSTEAASQTTLENIAPSAIKPHPSNPRHHVGDVTELAESIRSQGVLEPLIVAPIPDAAKTAKHRYLLIAGHRRHAAATLAKAKTVPAIVRADLDTPAKQLEAQLVENLHRADLTPVEEGDAYQALLDLGEGYTQDKIAKATGRSKTIVRDRLKVSSLPESVRDRILKGQVTITDAVAMAEFNGDPEALARLDKAAGTYNFAWTLQNLRDSRRIAREHAKALKELAKAGVTVLDDYPDDDAIDVMDLVPYTDEEAEAALDPQTESEQIAKAVADHASCPGHTAVLPEHRGDPEWICTRPDLHDDRPAKDAENAAPIGPSPEQLQREADERDLASAAKVRRAYLGQIVRAADNEAMALQFFRDTWDAIIKRTRVSSWQANQLRVLAEVLYEAPDRISDEDLPDMLAATIRTLSLPALVILDQINLGSEVDLERAQNYVWRGDYGTAAWRKVLGEDFAYEWSDIELRMLGETSDTAEGVA